jgi:hypothetical protein
LETLGDTDEGSKAALDLIYEVKRRGHFAFFRSLNIHAAARYPPGYAKA